MEINHWAKLVKSGLVRANLENPTSDLLIIGHYGGFSTYKQDAWSGYAMKISDFIADVSGITEIFGGPGILITGTGNVKTISLDGTSGGGTNFTVQPEGVIQVALNDGTFSGDSVNVTNLDTLNIFAQAVPSGLNWAGSWVTSKNIGFAQDDVVYFEDPDSGIYYTYWAYNGAVPPDNPTGTAPLPGAGEASNTFWARLGLEGPTGATGLSTGIMKLYQWSTTVPTVFPADQSAYTWASGAFTPPSDIGLWSTSVPTNPATDEILWELTQQFTLSPLAAVINIAWTTTSPKPIAYYGDTGTNGKTVLSGSGAPNNSLGEDGDFYIDTASAEYTMYGPKASGNWLTNTPKDLKGTDGISINWLGNLAVAPTSPDINDAYYNTADGKSYIWTGLIWSMMTQDGLTGSITYSVNGTASPTLGVAGDYYINTASANYTMYGPKLVNNDWTGATALDLKGPAGAPGGAVVSGTGDADKTGASYTLLATDASKIIKINTTFNSVSITIPDTLTTMTNGSQVIFVWAVRAGLTNTVSFTTTGLAVLKSANTMRNLRTLYSAATLIKISNTEYYLFGDLSPF
jgi:hypothetical protein